jgi:hypothetical protein
MKEDKNKPRTVVYIPKGAKINIENISDEPPKTRYERRRVRFDVNAVKKMVGGRYGKSEE